MTTTSEPATLVDAPAVPRTTRTGMTDFQVAVLGALAFVVLIAGVLAVALLGRAGIVTAPPFFVYMTSAAVNT